MTKVFSKLEEALVVIVPLEQKLLVILGLLRFDFGLHRGGRGVSCDGVWAISGWGLRYRGHTFLWFHHWIYILQPKIAELCIWRSIFALRAVFCYFYQLGMRCIVSNSSFEIKKLFSFFVQNVIKVWKLGRRRRWRRRFLFWYFGQEITWGGIMRSGRTWANLKFKQKRLSLPQSRKVAYL